MTDTKDRIQVIGFTTGDPAQWQRETGNDGSDKWVVLSKICKQEEYWDCLSGTTAERVMIIDLDRVAPGAVGRIIHDYREHGSREGVYYLSSGKKKLWMKCIDPTLFRGDSLLTVSPVLIGEKRWFLHAYAGNDLDENPVKAISYSLQKSNAKFYRLQTGYQLTESVTPGKEAQWVNYLLKIPARFLFSGAFFKTLFQPQERVRRDMVCRFLMVLFGLFTLLYMPLISKDYGISGDEYVDHRHAGLVMDYFTKGDKAALHQPKTTLHLYGNVVQVVSAVVARVTGADDAYRVRHAVCALTGAMGIVCIGLLGLRLGGGLCGLLAMLMLFFSPRYFGHSMNNLKDIPFAVGYLMALFYSIRLFDRYPVFKLRHMLGLIFGICIALGTRSGGLLLFPYLLMYGGLFYILWTGWKEWYKLGKHIKDIENILIIILLTLAGGYILSILLWPFALDKPMTNVIVSLREFTNYSLGLRTIFEGKQVMSNMLPMHYAPKYLLIASPLVVVVGWIGYMIYMAVRPKNFTLMSFFLLFALIFPVFWVIYKKSNLYGGIRHMLFVMPVMVALAAHFWTCMLSVSSRVVKLVVLLLFCGLLFLPVRHMVRNHPNDYIYFNELVGGLQGAYGDYETDYYYNSLKEATDWFKEHVDYKDRPVTIITNHSASLQHYFRKDTNVTIIYGRYYEKFEKDWDYMIFANVYINSYQLKNGLFPVQEGLLYTVETDGLPMCFVGERVSKKELEGIRLLEENDLQGAAEILEEYLAAHPWNEEMWMRLARIYYAQERPEDAIRAADESLKLQPQLMDALTVKALNAIELGRLREAHQAADAMIEQNNLVPTAYFLKAEAYSREYKDKEAVEQLNKALRYNPNYDQALVLAGDILKRNGNFAQAVNPYSKVAQRQRADEKTLQSLADCYLRVKNMQGFQQIVDLLERQGTDRYGLSKLQLRAALMQQKAVEAAALLEQMDKADDDAEMWVLQAMYELQQGRRGTAGECLEKALSINPRDYDANQLRKTLSSNQR